MSRIRTGHGPDDWQRVDDGAIGRAHFSRWGIRGGSDNPVMGAMPTGESERQRDNRLSRESKARLRVPA